MVYSVNSDTLSCLYRRPWSAAPATSKAHLHLNNTCITLHAYCTLFVITAGVCNRCPRDVKSKPNVRRECFRRRDYSEDLFWTARILCNRNRMTLIEIRCKTIIVRRTCARCWQWVFIWCAYEFGIFRVYRSHRK